MRQHRDESVQNSPLAPIPTEPPVDCLMRYLARCQYHYLAGTSKLALGIASEGIDLARRVADKTWLRRLLTAYGVLQGDTMNLPAAVAAFSEALDICDSLSDPAQHAAVWANLSGTLLYAGMPSVAIRACQTALTFAERSPLRERRMTERISFTNIAYACLETGQYRLGLQCVPKALLAWECESLEVSPTMDTLQRCLCSRNFARLFLRVGDLQSAKEHTERALELAKLPHACPRTVRSAQLALGMYEVYSGKVAAGVERIVVCMEASRDNEPAVEATYIRALIEAYLLGGDVERADACFRKLSAVVRSLATNHLLFHCNQHFQGFALEHTDTGMAALHPRTRLRASASPDRKYETLENLSAAAELHDDESGEHTYRVARLAALLAERIGQSADFVREISKAALFHDVGKVAVPASILRKQGSLTGEEVTVMRQHATIGADLLASTRLDLGMACSIAQHHHEFWSGGGYPAGLAGIDIPLEARLVAIAENFDAMTHDRPYRPRMSVSRALQVIAERAGTQFDPALVEPFCELIAELTSRCTDLDAYLAAEARNASGFVYAHRRVYECLLNGDADGYLVN